MHYETVYYMTGHILTRIREWMHALPENGTGEPFSSAAGHPISHSR